MRRSLQALAAIEGRKVMRVVAWPIDREVALETTFDKQVIAHN
jgi:hypothetical protein